MQPLLRHKIGFNMTTKNKIKSLFWGITLILIAMTATAGMPIVDPNVSTMSAVTGLVIIFAFLAAMLAIIISAISKIMQAQMTAFVDTNRSQIDAMSRLTSTMSDLAKQIGSRPCLASLNLHKEVI